MNAFRDHFAHHRLHMAGCALGCVAVITALVLGVPVLAALGALACAAMMIGMVWMMVAMAGRHHD